MSDTSQKSPADQLDEELVAYLDGELESQAAQRLETMLATDERARQRLSQLAVSWDLLDQLPRATVDDLFTRTTVEMVAVAAEDEIAQSSAAAPARQRRRWLGAGVATLLAAAVGFVATGLIMPDQNDPLLRNLPVVVNLDLYRSVGDVDLLKKLGASGLFLTDSPSKLFRSDLPAGAAPVATPLAPQPTNVPPTISQRRAWIAALSPDRKLELNGDLEKFVALSPSEKQSLLGIDEYLQANPEQADNLTRLMQRYHDWLKSLTPPERADLSDTTTPEDHLAEIRKIKLEQEWRLFARLGGGRGTPRDVDHLVRWLQDFAGQHEKEILEAIPEDRQQDFKKPPRPGNEIWGQQFYQRRLAWELWQPNSPVKMPEISEADVEPLLAQLSADKQAELKAATDTDQRVEVLRQWIRAAIAEQRPRFTSQGDWRRGGGMSPERRAHIEEEIKRFADSLPAEEKERLEKLPTDQRRVELMKLYQKQHFPSGRPGRGFQRLPGRCASRRFRRER